MQVCHHQFASAQLLAMLSNTGRASTQGTPRTTSQPAPPYTPASPAAAAAGTRTPAPVHRYICTVTVEEGGPFPNIALNVTYDSRDYKTHTVNFGQSIHADVKGTRVQMVTSNREEGYGETFVTIGLPVAFYNHVVAAVNCEASRTNESGGFVCHLLPKYHWLQEQVEDKVFSFDYVPTSSMRADGWGGPRSDCTPVREIQSTASSIRALADIADRIPIVRLPLSYLPQTTLSGSLMQSTHLISQLKKCLICPHSVHVLTDTLSSQKWHCAQLIPLRLQNGCEFYIPNSYYWLTSPRPELRIHYITLSRHCLGVVFLDIFGLPLSTVGMPSILHIYSSHQPHIRMVCHCLLSTCPRSSTSTHLTSPGQALIWLSDTISSYPDALSGGGFGGVHWVNQSAIVCCWHVLIYLSHQPWTQTHTALRHYLKLSRHCPRVVSGKNINVSGLLSSAADMPLFLALSSSPCCSGRMELRQSHTGLDALKSYGCKS